MTIEKLFNKSEWITLNQYGAIACFILPIHQQCLAGSENTFSMFVLSKGYFGALSGIYFEQMIKNAQPMWSKAVIVAAILMVFGIYYLYWLRP